MEKTMNRVSWIDMAKGYGIILVIIGHLNLNEQLNLWIYSFHMPLFFFLSGYVFKHKDDFKHFVKGKVKSMIIPYFFFGFILLTTELIIGFRKWNFNSEDVIRVVRGYILQERMWTLWFLACLFLLQIIFYFAVRYLKTNVKLAVFSVVMAIVGLIYYKYINIPLLWNIDVCFTAIPFFSAGYICKCNKTLIADKFEKKSVMLCMFAVLGVINIATLVMTVKITGSGLEMYAGNYGFAPLTYISAFAGIACVIIASKWFTVSPIKYIGENSMLYFALHQTLMMPVVTWLLSLVHLTLDIANNTANYIRIYRLIEFILILTLITILNILISKSRFRFVLGK